MNVQTEVESTATGYQRHEEGRGSLLDLCQKLCHQNYYGSEKLQNLREMLQHPND